MTEVEDNDKQKGAVIGPLLPVGSSILNNRPASSVPAAVLVPVSLLAAALLLLTLLGLALLLHQA
jgi:hypothetical protein